MELDPFVVYLIGVPAVGKYTAATELARLTGARVVDNQLVNIPVFTVLGYDGTDRIHVSREAWDEIGTIRGAVLRVVRDLTDAGASFVFTNVLDANEPRDRELFDDIAALAETRGAAFFPVWLTCARDEIVRRKGSPDRRARLKDVDTNNVRRWLERFTLLRVEHPNGLEIDTTSLPASGVARAIVDHMARAGQIARR